MRENLDFKKSSQPLRPEDSSGGQNDPAYERKVAEEKRRIKLDQPRARVEQKATPDEIITGRFRPKGGMRRLKRSEVEAAAPASKKLVALEQKEESKKIDNVEEEPEIVLPVRAWLNAIFKQKLEENDDEIMQRYFIVSGNKFSLTAEMSIEQVTKAYANYLMDKGASSKKALDLAKSVIKKETGVEVNIPYLDEKPGEPSAADMRALEKKPAFIALAEELKRARGGVKVNGEISSTEKSSGRIEPLNGLADQLEQATPQGEENPGEERSKYDSRNKKSRIGDNGRGGSTRRHRIEELKEKEVARDDEE